jgi:hypothetical protein
MRPGSKWAKHIFQVFKQWMKLKKIFQATPREMNAARSTITERVHSLSDDILCNCTKVSYSKCPTKLRNTRLRELHNETPADDAHTSSLLHFQRVAILAIWQLPPKQPPKPHLLDQEEQRTLKAAVNQACNHCDGLNLTEAGALAKAFRLHWGVT